jgi:hypothetical protein
MKIRSMVGLIPLFVVETLEPEALERLPDFKRRLEWFIDNRPDLTETFACMRSEGMGDRRLLSIAHQDQLRSILKYMLDEREFLSPYGIRALSRFHQANPYSLRVNGSEHRVEYEPGESSTGIWRQFELARSDLVSSEFSPDRVSAKVPALFRPRFQSRVPDWLRKHEDVVGRGGRTVASYDKHLSS